MSSSFRTPIALPNLREGTQDEMVARQVLSQNQYDLPDKFDSEDVILDFGAHVGSFAAACLQRGAGLVVCFEPDPTNFDLLRRNLTALFDPTRFILHQQALSAPGVKGLRFKSTKVLGTWTACSAHRPDGDISVVATDLGAVLKSFPRVRLLKIDAEGAEWHSLPHLRPGDLDHVQEISGESHQVKEFSHEDIRAFLLPHGFDTKSVGLEESVTEKGEHHNHLFFSKRVAEKPAKANMLIVRFPYGGSERAEIGDWLWRTAAWAIKEERLGDVKLHRLNDTPITMTRNEAVRIVKELGYDLLLMVDSDLVPDCEGSPDFLPTAFEFWRRHAGPCVVAAPYGGPPPDENPYVFLWRNGQNDTPEPEARLCMYTRDEAADLTGTKRAAALPTGLMLIDVKALDAIEEPYFYYEFTDKARTAKASTEDVTFSRDLDLAGVPQYCTWDCWAGHVKTKIVRKPQPIRLAALPGKFVDAVKRQHSAGHERTTPLFPASCG